LDTIGLHIKEEEGNETSPSLLLVLAVGSHWHLPLSLWPAMVTSSRSDHSKAHARGMEAWQRV
jgi:hypothetical protein